MALRRTELKRGKAPQPRTRLLRRSPLRSDRLSCGSLRVHDGHWWLGQSGGRTFWCAGAARKAAGRPVPAVPASVRRALRKRSGGWCEMRLAGCRGRATDPCHRIATGSGGRHGQAKVDHDRLSNLLYGCRACHDWTHDNVYDAEDLGLMLREGDVPEREPVRLPGHSPVPVLLDNEGGFTEVRGVAA